MCVGVSVWLGWSGIRVAGWSWCASAWNTDTTPTQPHRNANTHRTKNNTTNVVIQQNSRKLLMMDILMSETRCAHKKWNEIASNIKLVFYSSTITMMHGPINITEYELRQHSHYRINARRLHNPRQVVAKIRTTYDMVAHYKKYQRQNIISVRERGKLKPASWTAKVLSCTET